MSWLRTQFRRLGGAFGLLRQVAAAVAFLALVTVLMLWLAGRFSPKVPRQVPAGSRQALPTDAPVAVARLVRVPLLESAVGTMRSVYETTVASRLLSRVVQVDLKAGQPVRKDEVLVRLDDTDLKARLSQAESAVVDAQAQYDQAVIDERRRGNLLRTHAGSEADYDKAATALKSAAASLARAGQARAESQAVLEYATIRSPMDGVVVDKKVNAGDTVTPGQPVVTVYDQQHMQLVAGVRESLARRLAVGQEIGVRLDVLELSCTGRVSEIVPDAQSESRTFQVKVTGPCPPGLYTGMFGRIFIPLGDEDVLVVPRAAVRNVGQLELVDVVEGGAPRRRAVRTGRVLGEDLEVLSGLEAGERVLLPAPPSGAVTRPLIATRPADPSCTAATREAP